MLRRGRTPGWVVAEEVSPSQSSLRRVCPWQYPKETSRLGFRGMSFLLPALTKRTPRYPPSAEPSRQLEAAFEGKEEKQGPVRQQRETKKGTRRWRLPVCKAKENGIRHLKRVLEREHKRLRGSVDLGGCYGSTHPQSEKSILLAAVRYLVSSSVLSPAAPRSIKER